MKIERIVKLYLDNLAWTLKFKNVLFYYKNFRNVQNVEERY